MNSARVAVLSKKWRPRSIQAEAATSF